VSSHYQLPAPVLDPATERAGLPGGLTPRELRLTVTSVADAVVPLYSNRVFVLPKVGTIGQEVVAWEGRRSWRNDDLHAPRPDGRARPAAVAESDG